MEEQINMLELVDMNETILLLIHTFIKNNAEIYSSPDLLEIIFDNIFDIMRITFYHDDLYDIIHESIEYYLNTIGIHRSINPTAIIKKVNKDIISEKIQKYKKIKQSPQNTKEWFEFRWNLLSASSMWKAMGSQASQNQLIYKKCCPLRAHQTHSNISSTLHHGHKYEPLSTIFYEYLYGTKIWEVGCKKHFEHDYIGASPDGINIKEDNERYGRMLEIKNIVNREITGIPKSEYWIQMQIQMEVWDLEECDFLETRFTEYEDEGAFNKDGGFDKSEDGKRKGVIICFYDGDKPIYEYSLFGFDRDEYEKWYETCMTINQKITWIRNIYWKLDQFSCVLVPRNRLWFNGVFQQIKKTWDTILYERTHGYEHRKPKKRKKKKILTIETEINSNNCKS